MKPLILDTDPKWLTHWQAQRVPTAQTLAAALPIIAARHINTVLLDARLMCLIPGLRETGVKIVIVSSLPLDSKLLAAYRSSGHAHAIAGYIEADYSLTPGKLARQLGRAKR